MPAAIYAGSFDPVTNGHEDIIARASQVFDPLYVGIGENLAKNPLFGFTDRLALLEVVCNEYSNVKVRSFNGLLVNFCKELEVRVIVRGLRAVSDFEKELGVAQTNAQLAPGIDTFFLPTRPTHSFVSSSTVKEIARHGGDVSYYLHPKVAEAVRIKLPPR